MDAAESNSLPRELVFVDLETTGGNAAFHRVTEVGIVRMLDGVVVEEWSSLVNPECRIPSYIEGFTGITNAMVADAPRFAEIAAVVLEKLRTPLGPDPAAPVFVAHNARFDYAFLRGEFRRLETNFSAKVLCTVKLSRRLYPEFPRHGLDAVMERHGLICTARHRALGDARVLADFWRLMLVEQNPERLASVARLVIGANRLPAYLPAELADELPEGPGVYRFFGEDGALLYIGKSHALRTRILGHFSAENSDAKEQKKARLVRRIDWLETAGDLGAQLTEAQWIKAQNPLFNRRLKAKSESHTLRFVRDSQAVVPAPLADFGAADLAECHGVFQTFKDARKALGDIARAQQLCLKVLGLEEGAGSCFGYQVGKCKGACVGKEPLMLHQIRLRMALSSLKLKAWPFPGRIALREGHAEFHVLDHWTYVGTAHTDDELSELAGRAAVGVFDVDVYRVLLRHLAKHPDAEWQDLRDRSAL